MTLPPQDSLSDTSQSVPVGDESKKHKRSIRSFVIRGGRMTVGQQRAYDALWPKYGLALSDGQAGLAPFLSQGKPVTLEIGFGMGKSLAQMADEARDRLFIGIEVHRPGVGALLMEMERLQLDNIRVFCDDAVEVLAQCIPDAVLDRVQLYFPDPWHKKKHHKRRIVQPEFVQKLRAKLMPGGVFHLATDWENYAEHMLDVMEASEGFSNLAGGGNYSPRPDFRPLTKFENRGIRLGHGVWDLLFERTR